MDKLKFILFILLLNLCCFGQKVKTPDTHLNSQVRFTQNKHQWDEHIAYRAQLDGGALFVERSGKLTFHFYDKDAYRAAHLGKATAPTLKFHAYSVEFPGSNENPQMRSEDKSYDYSNYYLGNDQKNWTSNVYHYQKINLRSLYPFIDAVYMGKNQSIKYNFIVNPGGNPADIKLQYKGVNSIKIQDGKLYLGTSVKNMIEEEPFVYQIISGDTVVIPSKFVLKDHTVSFKLLKTYNTSEPLIIDPLLIFAAQSGSTADNFGMTATYDERGNLYSGGTVFDVGYPTTTGAYDLSFNNMPGPGRTDVVITKYDSAGTFLRYSTYLGGNNAETVSSLIVDKNDNLCLYGTTGSNNFPTTTGCYDNSFNGGTYLSFVANGTTFNNGTDIYIAKFNSTGTSLLASTYIGGTANDGINHVNHLTNGEYAIDSLQYNYGDQYRGEIQADTSGNIYVLSSSRSPDFPMVNAIDNSLGGKQDAVLFKFNASLSTLYFSTYIGGSSNDSGNSLALDDSLNIYITGGTCGPDFVTTPGSYQTAYNGGKADGFICKIKKNGAYLMHSSYVGTTSYDQSYFVQLDRLQNVYLYGQSLGNMPVTSGVYANGGSKQFIQKFNPQLSTLMAATVFGNGTSNINISPSAFSVDCAGNIYISGWGGNILTGNATNGMAITGNALQSSTDGFNFYLMVLAPNMSSIIFGSYFGGPVSQEHVDGGTSRFDKNGIVYQSVCAGCVSCAQCPANQDFPVTPGAWPNTPGMPNHSNNCNNGVFKLDFQLNSASASIATSTLGGCAPLTVQFGNISTSGQGYLWDFGNHDTTSLILNPVKTFTAPGTYTAGLYVKKSICNNLYDTATVIITVQAVPVTDFAVLIDSCSNKINLVNQTNPLSTPPIWYINGTQVATTPNYSQAFVSAGTYTATLITRSSYGCADTMVKTIIVPVDSISINAPQTKCAKAVVPLLASGGSSYSWQPVAGLSNPFIANPTCNAQATTVYTVTITQNSLLNKICVKTLTTTVTVYPVINAAFNYTIGACRNDVTFTDASAMNPISWDWSFGDGVTSSAQSPSHSYNTPQLYLVSLIVTNSNGCKDTMVQSINLAGFDAITVSNPISKCSPDTVQLNATGGQYYQWAPPAGLSSTTIKNPKAFPAGTTIYTVTIGNIVGTDTCKTLLTTTVTVYTFTYNPGSISLSSLSVGIGQTATITLSGFTYTGTLSIEPYIPVRMVSNEVYVISPTKTGEYEISFTDQYGCTHHLKTIFVEMITDACNEGTVYLPTGFTPNGDGVNDILYIRSNFITEVYLTIYDRWGEKLFETDNIKKGWDGLYKGKQLDQGVYGYYMTFKCNNGQESFKKGNITLMR